MTIISAVEASSLVVTAVLTDEDDVSVVPDSVTWTLVDASGNVINSREDVVLSPAASVDAVLSGADLPWYGQKITDTYSIYITFKAVYDSSLENNLPLIDEAKINIRNILSE